MIILAIDPSGNFDEGKGHTGWVYVVNGTVVDKGTVRAENYDNRVSYWSAVTGILSRPIDVLIIEDYRLYNTAGTRAAVQSYSQLETPRLLGVLEFMSVINHITPVFQMATVTKPYSDAILVKLGIIEHRGTRYLYNGVLYNDHERSALRHYLYWKDKHK